MSAAGSKEKEEIEEVDEEKRGAGKELCEFVKRPWYVLKRGVDQNVEMWSRVGEDGMERFQTDVQIIVGKQAYSLRLEYWRLKQLQFGISNFTPWRNGISLPERKQLHKCTENALIQIFSVWLVEIRRHFPEIYEEIATNARPITIEAKEHLAHALMYDHGFAGEFDPLSLSHTAVDNVFATRSYKGYRGNYYRAIDVKKFINKYMRKKHNLLEWGKSASATRPVPEDFEEVMEGPPKPGDLKNGRLRGYVYQTQKRKKGKGVYGGPRYRMDRRTYKPSVNRRWGGDGDEGLREKSAGGGGGGGASGGRRRSRRRRRGLKATAR